MSEAQVSLTVKQIQQGKTLITKLDQSGLKLEVAFWLYDKKRNPPWTLFLASSSPEMDVKEDVLKARKALSTFVQEVFPFDDLSSFHIELIPLDHPFISSISTTLNTGYEIANISMSNNRFDELFIEQLYLYRMCL